MDSEAIEPFGLALLGYFRGNRSATLTIRRNDGVETILPAGRFFRAPDEFSAIENTALDLCRGRVLDVGAGSGLHSLALQAAGHSVTAMDIRRHAASQSTSRPIPRGDSRSNRVGAIFVTSIKTAQKNE